MTPEEIKQQKTAELFQFMYEGGYFEAGINELVTSIIDSVLQAGFLSDNDTQNWARIKAQIYIICNK